MQVKQFYGQFDPKIDEAAWGYFDPSFKGGAIEVGACDGKFFSNTLAFEEAGWTCLAIEPDPSWHTALKQNRRNFNFSAIGDKDGIADLTIYTQGGHSDHSAITSIRPDQRLVDQYSGKPIAKIKVPLMTLDTAIRVGPIFQSIDFVSIDTEGTELDVLKGFDIHRWKPKLFVIENNYEDPDVAEYLKPFGYKLDKRIGVNDFFIRE